MFSGSTADRLGRKRTFVTGLTVFSVASLLCSLAPSVGLLLTLRFIPESRAASPRRFDPVGQGLVIVLFATLTYAIIEAPSRGSSSPVILASVLASGAALLALLLYEPRREDPLVDLRFFRSVPFTSSIIISVAAFAAFGGFLFLNTLYLQEGRGLSPVQAGLLTVPMAVMTVVASPLSGRIVGRRRSPRPPDRWARRSVSPSSAQSSLPA
jgi:MFS family permease